jgi:hypothetical protein
MTFTLLRMRLGLTLAAAALLAATPAAARPVLLISIDGLRPGDLTEAEQRGLKIPNLRRFMVEGSYAQGVIGVLPTLTYPSHITLLTGASPAAHGILSNNTFDPAQINAGGWYWYASDIKLPTLWSAAARAGLKVGNVHWPVSVGAAGIRWNLPQIWRTGHADDAKLVAALATPGLLGELEGKIGAAYAAGIDETIEADELRGRFGVALIRSHKPDLTTVYLTALDHEQHGTGPGSPEAHAVLERIDAIVGQLVAAAKAAHPQGAIAIVSDHGFEASKFEINFFRAFIDAGLIRLDAAGKVASWDAMPWPSGGSAAVVLARRDDRELGLRVRALLDRLQADPVNRINAIITRGEIARMGGNPLAEFYVNLEPDTYAAGFAGAAAPLIGASTRKGMHGYFPQALNLRSSFMIMGPGIAQARSLGEIDMRAIAPTLAKELRIKLAGAERPALDIAD